MKSLLMLILIFFYNCSNSNFGSKDDLLRGFALTYPDPAPKQNLKLSIQGQLKDGKGNPMAYKLMSTSQGLDSSAQVRQSTNTVKVRFVDYSLKPNKLKGMFIIQNESDESKIAKYDLYWGDESTKAKIASFTKTGKKLQFVIDEVERPSFAKKFFLFSADTGQVNTVELENTKVQDTSAGTITDKDGNFELKLDAGVKTDVNIQDPVKDVASFSADLTKIDSLEKMNDLQKSIAEKGFTEGFLNAYTQSSGGISLTGSVIAISEPVSTSNTTITTASTTPSEPVINFNEVVSTTTTAVTVTTTTTTVTPVTPPPTYTIEVNVTGLTGTGLVLQNNASNNLSISGNGSIPFSGSFPQGSTYDVKVLTQPTGQTCAITGGSGTLLTSAAVMVNCSSSLKEITSFSLVNPALVGTISGTNISLTVPFGTSLTALVANFVTTGSNVKVGSTVQSSGTTTNDFSSPVTYTVTAADSSTQTYTVTVTEAPSTAKSITSFGFVSPAVTGSITGNNISLTVPFGTSLTALVANFITSGASVKVGSAVQSSGITANDFSSPVIYTVTAADGSTQSYTITVTVAANTAKSITSFSFVSPAITGSIVGTNISVALPYNSSVTALVANFVTTGASVKVGSTTQVSGTTANNFSSPVTYTVTAADSSTQNYTVTVTVNANNPPTASSVAISGTLSLGSTLTGSFTYSDPDGHAAGTHTYQWYRCTDDITTGSCSSISGATATTYVIQTSDDGKYLRFEVTPKDTYSLAGTAVKSSATSIIDCGLPPTLSDNVLKVTALTSTSIALQWTAASDGVTAATNLQYLLYYSTGSSISTVAEIEANGTAVGTYAANTTSKTVTGLTSNTAYYFNVIVKDAAGNKSAYKIYKEFPFTGMTAYYPMNGNANDVVGGYNGTIYGTVTATTDSSGNANSAYSFNGTNGYIEVPYNANLNPSAFTISAVVNSQGSPSFGSVITSRNSTPGGYILYDDAGTGDWSAWIGYNTTCTGTGFTGGAWCASTTTASNRSLNTWYNLTLTYDGTTLNFYRDGQLYKTGTATLTVNTTSPMRIGAGATEGAAGLFFKGSIDNVRIYNRALSTAEVQTISGKYTFTGPITNVALSSLYGWSVCFTENYGNTTSLLSTVLSNCNKANLMLACRATATPSTIILAAYAPRADVTFDTTSDSTTVHNANGVGWYYYPTSKSWGFALQGDSVTKSSCDTASTNPDKRLCWHTASGNINSGYRCGATTGADATYERLILHAD